MKALASKISALSKKLVNAELKPLSEVEPATHYTLFYKGRPVAEIGVFAAIKNGTATLVIDEIQGWPKVKAEIDQFKKDNGLPWNVAMVDFLVSSAYEARFDRVLLADITDSSYYENTSVDVGVAASQKEKLDKIKYAREKMKQLYTWTAKACGFTKMETNEHGRFYVREFP